jgi:hypothetical protein
MVLATGDSVCAIENRRTDTQDAVVALAILVVAMACSSAACYLGF